MPTVKAYISQVNPGAQPAGPQLPLDNPAIRAQSQVAQTLGEVSNAAFARADQWQKQKDQLEVEAYKSEISDIVRKKRQEIVEREGRNAEGSTKEMEGLFAETAKSYEGKLKNSNQQQLFTSYVTAARDVGVDFAARHESQQRQIWKGEVREAATVRAMSDAEAYPGSLPKILEDLEGSLGNLFSGHVKEAYWEPARSKVIRSAIESLIAQKEFGNAQGLTDRYREFLSGSDEISLARTIKSLSEEHEVETILNKFYTDPEGAAADAARLPGYQRAAVESRIKTLQESKKQDEEKQRREAARAEKQAIAAAVIGKDMVAADKAIQLAVQSGNMDGEALIQFNEYKEKYQAGLIKQATEKAKAEWTVAVYAREIKDVDDLARLEVHPDEWKGLLELADKVAQGLGGQRGYRNMHKVAEEWFDAQVKTKSGGTNQAELASVKQDFLIDLAAIAEKEDLGIYDQGVMAWAKKLYEEGSYVLEERPGFLTRNVRTDRLAGVFRYRREKGLGIQDLIEQYRPEIVPTFRLSETADANLARIGETYETEITSAAQRWKVDPDLILAMIQVESNGNPNAVSHAGAKGLMQLMPGTAEGLGVIDSANPAENVYGGAKYISQMLERYGGNLELAVAAYNAGPGRVKDKIPAIAETRNYVAAVLANYKKLKGGAPAEEPKAVGYEALDEVYGPERVKELRDALTKAGKLDTPETVRIVAEMKWGEKGNKIRVVLSPEELAKVEGAK